MGIGFFGKVIVILRFFLEFWYKEVAGGGVGILNCWGYINRGRVWGLKIFVNCGVICVFVFFKF